MLTIWTDYPEVPQEKRCNIVDTVWMVWFGFGDMFKSVKLVVEFGDTRFLDLSSNVFLMNSILSQPYGWGIAQAKLVNDFESIAIQHVINMNKI